MKTTTLALSALACASFATAGFNLKEEVDYALDIIQTAGSVTRSPSLLATCAVVSVNDTEAFTCVDQAANTCENSPCADSGWHNSTTQEPISMFCDGFEGHYTEFPSTVQVCDCQQTCYNVVPIMDNVSASAVAGTTPTSTVSSASQTTTVPSSKSFSSSSSPSSTATPSSSSSSKSQLPIAVIAGAVAGGLVLLGVVGGLIACCVVRNKKKQAAAAAARYSQQTEQFRQGYYSPGSSKNEFVA